MTDEQYSKARTLKRLREEATDRAEHYQNLINQHVSRFKYHLEGEDFAHDITADEIEALYKYNCDLISKLDKEFQEL